MLKNKRLLLVSVALIVLAFVVLAMRISFPHHRLLGSLLLALGWGPVIVSYRINRQLLRAHKTVIKQKTRPYLPHACVAVVLLAAFYISWVLFPVEKSPLADMAPEQIRAELALDLDSHLMLRKVSDDIVGRFTENGLLQRPVDGLSSEERNLIRSLWRDGVMAFLEFDLLKHKYRGFYQIDYIAQPQLHADAFLLAYMAYIVQYDACLQLFAMVDGNAFMKTLLNEAGEGIPPDTFFKMQHWFTNPHVMLRINAGTAYYELVKKDFTTDHAVVSDFERRRKTFFRRMGSNADIIIKNPLSILERVAFDTLFPVQKAVALQMSRVRTARRDYLITAQTLASCRDRLQPGDILVQRRNWHMTNIGIPGFWPHIALYVGTPPTLEAYFSELDLQPMDMIGARYPDVFHALQSVDDDGFPNCVIESIRPGVVFQSLETSANCDYLGVIRPNLSKAEMFEALLSAFSHAGKPYDLNFDFTTDNALVCSELVYKAFKSGGRLPFVPEVVNGRLLLPPNRMVEQAVENMGDETAPFSFVLFLDAEERSGRIIEQDAEAFKASYVRPKWDILQQ